MTHNLFHRDGDAEVAVVIVAYNSAEDIGGLIASLRGEADEVRLRVVVADNSSSDETVAIVEGHDDVILVHSGGNIGYSAGINVAMQHVGSTEAILVLNPDLRVEPGAVRQLLLTLQSDQRLGVVVPRILDTSGATAESLRREPTLLRGAADAVIGRHWPARPAALSEYVRDPRAYDAARKIEWATGAALMFSSAAAASIGAWDERFFLYSEETDFFRRARAAGWVCVYDPLAHVTHRSGGSGASNDLVALTIVNRIRYMDKHRPRSAELYRALVIIGEQLRRGDATHARARWALWHRSRWTELPGPSRDAITPESVPQASIIIPAHNEAAVIARTLLPLSALAVAGRLDVVVVCNGCTDATADVARSVPGIRVVEIKTASKIAALNAGDSAAQHWPRLYLDADIEVSPEAIADTISALNEGGVLAARPAFVVKTAGADWRVRAYYRARSRMPSMSAALWGAGVYGMSAEGHQRLGSFPELTADDLHVDRLFHPTEKRIVATTPVSVRSPLTTPALLSILSRARRGAAEQSVDTGGSSLRELSRTVRGPSSAFDAAIYASLAAAARRRGNATAESGREWERDESSRASPGASARTVDHVIVTRFNLPSPGPESLVRAQDGWLRNRVDLFERYTVPSMRGQSSRDFTWMIYFDPESPSWLIDRLAPLAAERLFTPLYRESVEWQDVARDAREVSGGAREVLLTTNLDNDDAIAPDFASRLQTLAATNPGSAIFLANGLIVQNGAVYLRHDPENAFCSVSETWANPVTAWRDWHTLLHNHFPVVSDGGNPGWLQVVHGQNVSNRVRGVRVSPDRYRALFPGMLDGAPSVGRGELAVDRFLRAPLRAAKEGLRSGGKQIVLRVIGKDGLDRLKERLGRRG